MLKILYKKWMYLAERIGTMNARIILTVLYFSMVAPFGLLLRVCSDPLRLRRHTGISYWVSRPRREVSLEEMKKQF